MNEYTKRDIFAKFTWAVQKINLLPLRRQNYKTFAETKSKTAEEVYGRFYESSYAAAEKAHHVSNDITISIGMLQSEQKLEILEVYEADYRVPETEEDKNLIESLAKYVTGVFDRDVELWLEVPGKGPNRHGGRISDRSRCRIIFIYKIP